MKKFILLVLFLNLFSFSLYASEYDKEVIVIDQSRDEKVKKVFKEMMESYEDGGLNEFFSFVSEDRFEQDYVTFYEAIENDMRVYDILSIESWVDKITTDGVKKFLYVRWEKRYESIDDNTELNKKGYSRFLFDEINGHYKLIALAGNNFWGESLPEWKEEVPKIAGQVEESQDDELPDLTVTIVECSSGKIYFRLNNIGNKDTNVGMIEYEVFDDYYNSKNLYHYDDDIARNSSTTILNQSHNCISASDPGYVEVDPNDLIDEEDNTNNKSSL